MLILKLSFFAEAYLIEDRASKRYHHFIDTLLLYQTIFDGGGDIMSLLQLPFPLYTDVILRQVKEKQREKKLQEERMNTLQKTKTKAAQPMKHRR
jgi:hypothetical protein